MANPNPRLENLKPFTGADDPRRVDGSVSKGIEHSSTRLKRLLELTEQLKNPVTGVVEGFTVLEQLDLQQIIRARRGDPRSYELILDRLEGKPKQTIDAKFNGAINVEEPKTLQTLLKIATAVLSDKNEPTSNTTPPKKG